MRRPAFLLAAVAAAALALAPAIADARPGGGASSGSRGSRTYSTPPSTSTAPNQARSFDRTATEPSRGGVPGTQSAAQAGRPGFGQQGGFFSRNPMLAGLAGGLLGAGLFGLLGGHGLFGGLGGIAGIFGLLLQLALIGGLVFLVMRLIRGRSAAQPAMAGVPNRLARDAMPQGGPRPLGGAGGGPAGVPVTIEPADFEAFERTLKDVNAAWSRGDVPALRRIATPEMVQYFEDDIAALQARGWRNETRDLTLEQGDLAEAWQEGGRDYATVAMRFSLIDVTHEVASGRVVEGDPARRTQATELWTFVRPAAGRWVLSAIQQTS